MHTDLSKHLHSDKCIELINLLTQCRQSNPFGKFIGSCNIEDYRLNRCLKEERIEQRRINYEKSLEKQHRMRQLWQKESNQQ